MSGHCNRKVDGVDVWMLKELGCRSLVCCLEELPGKKDFVIDASLMKFLDRLSQAATLRQHDVDKIYKLEQVPPSGQCSQRMYMIRPTPDAVKLIAEHINHRQQEVKQEQLQLQNQSQSSVIPLSRVLVVCVPSITYAVECQLEEEGLSNGGIVSFHPFCPGFVPLDDDLLTLEMPNFFRDAFVDGDMSSCAGIGQSLHVLCSVYGSPQRVLSHGRAAHSVITAFHRLRSDRDHTKSSSNMKCEIGHLFVLDRDADLVTTLLTQLTYEGSIDEHYGIQAGVVELPHNVTPDGNKSGPSKVLLNSKDSVFASVRHKHFAGVPSMLVKRAKEIQLKKEDSKNMTPGQMRDFVAGDLKLLQAQQNSISLHLSVCEAITKATKRDFDVQLTTEHGLVTGATPASEAKAYFEDCCARQLPLASCLRLLCLLSLTQSYGLSTKEYEALTAQLVAACGYRHIISLFDLRQAGLLTVSDVSTDQPQGSTMRGLRQAASNFMNKGQFSSWRSLAKSLKLIPDADELIDLHNPSHLSYVFNGAYTPAIVQLISLCLTDGIQSVSDALKLIPGSTTATGWSNDTTNLPPVVLVLVLGGVTFAELAAFKLLGLRTGNRIVIATTGTISGNKLINSIANSG
ncbi:Sec1-like protein [Trinorchestia longiramus]|nr:Sec1-like protein [Trinorchestia longiramus]